MSIFDLRQSVIDEYSKYVQSFLSIADERVRSFIEESLSEILYQGNRTYGST